MNENKRLHFGVIFSNLDDTCQYNIWNGIVDYAKKNDIDLTAYIGVYQTTNYDLALHYKTCYELIKNNGSLDGVIIYSGFIASTIGEVDLEKYIVNISEILPLVSISYVMPGIPSVLVDNTAGIYDAVDHLIKVHGKKNIAFVKGPEGHLEAEDRFLGYKKALAANGIEYDERYIFPGNFTHQSGQIAVIELLGNSEITADAIVTCDDTIAVGVLRELKNQNLLVPTDIAVAGFDDDRDSATFIPSISTVKQDFFNIGKTGAEVLHKKVRDIPVEEVTCLSPVFIARQSCGCLEVEIFTTDKIYSEETVEDHSLITYITNRFMQLFIQNTPRPKIDLWAASLVDAVKSKPFSEDRFLHLLNEELINYSQYSKDIMVWNEALCVLIKGVELYSNEVENPYKVLATLVQATAIVQEVRFKEVKIKDLSEADIREMLRRIASNIVSKFDIDPLIKEMQKLLPELLINTVLIGLYNAPINSNDSYANRSINRIIGFDGNRIINSQSYETGPALSFDYSTNDMFSNEKRRDFFLFPLFFKEEEYGVMLIPFDPGISVDTYETLRINISTAVKGAGLIKEVEQQNALLNSALERATEASKAKSDFLSAMSHEMRTPMNAIIGMTAIGKKASKIEDKDYTLNKIEDASSHLLGVISDVLDMAKIEANKLILTPVKFDFNRMLQKALAIINYRADEKEQTLTVSVDRKVPRFIISDDQRLTQVITNLLSNAVKFTPEGGKIQLAISLLHEINNTCELCITVTDNGIGISVEQQANLFRAFEQAESGTNRNFGGTGLGLVISKTIVELMGGKLWVESELGEGAKFSFTIKALSGEDSKSTHSSHDVRSGQPAGGIDIDAFKGKTILLVEDIEINREIFIAFLEDYGFVIECAENGKEALEMVKAFPGRYDIVFMDLQMPVMGGHEATREIRSLPAMKDVKLPIIAMTANVFKSDIEECLASGMDDHLGKPLDIDKLLQSLSKYLLS